MLLTEYRPFKVDKILVEQSIKQDKPLIVSGILQRAEAKNQNGRIYPREILEREADKYTKEFIGQRRAMGELDHPESSVVNLQNVSHNVKEMHWEGDNLLGTVEVLGTPSGNILKELFKSGIKLGISSRGMGSVETVTEDNGGQSQEVQDDFELIAFDFVSNPSTHGAFLHPTNESINESKIVGRTCGDYCKVESIINDIMRGS